MRQGVLVLSPVVFGEVAQSPATDSLAEAADRAGRFFQHRLGRCFGERVGQRFGESQVYLERADEDRKAKVQRWKVVRPVSTLTA